MNNLLLVAAIVASISGAPADAGTRFETAGVDAFDMSRLVAANTRMGRDAVPHADLATCFTVGGLAELMTAAGYRVSDEEIATNAALVAGEAAYRTGAARIRAVDLAELRAKADADLRPFLDAAGDDLVAVRFEENLDAYDVHDGLWLWPATVVCTFASGRSVTDTPLEMWLRPDGTEVVRIGCEPHDARSMIAELAETVA